MSVISTTITRIGVLTGAKVSRMRRLNLSDFAKPGILVLLAFVPAGCINGYYDVPGPQVVVPQQTVGVVAPAKIEKQELPPIDNTPGGQYDTRVVASVPPSTPAGSGIAKKPKTTRLGLIGFWKIGSVSGSCQLYLTLTSWKSGKRASTRGCYSPELSKVSAWNLNGATIQLNDNNGKQVATLAKTANDRFDGTTTKGKAVSIWR